MTELRDCERRNTSGWDGDRANLGPSLLLAEVELGGAVADRRVHRMWMTTTARGG